MNSDYGGDMFLRIIKIIGIYLLSLIIVDGLYHLLGLFPDFVDSGDECNKAVELVLYVYVPLGYALYTFPADGAANGFEKFVSFIGFLIMVISTALLHLKLMNTSRAAVGHLIILPFVWIYINITYHNIGNETFEGWDMFKMNLECLLFLIFSLVIVTWLIVSIFGDTEGITFIVLAGISMGHLAISRIKNGSAFN